MSSRIAMALAAFVAAGVLAGFAWAADAAKPEAAPLPGEDPRDQKVQEQLDTVKVKFDFNDQPLVDAVEFLQTLSKVNIVVDRTKLGEPPKTVTLKLTDVPLSTALKLITSQVGLRYAIIDGIVTISDEDGLRRPPVRAMYDVADLLKPRPGFKVKDPDEALAELIDVIKQTIAPGSWDEGSGNAIRGIDGTLVMMHTPDVHREVRQFLAELRKVRESDAKH